MTQTHNRILALRPLWRTLASHLQRWLHNSRSRATLADLPAHMLADIGIDPGIARCEAARPFWQGGHAASRHRAGLHGLRPAGTPIAPPPYARGEGDEHRDAWLVGRDAASLVPPGVAGRRDAL
ncbi:MAG: DUF1127 domain-containing protein [Pseudomonadota bacterium]